MSNRRTQGFEPDNRHSEGWNSLKFS